MIFVASRATSSCSSLSASTGSSKMSSLAGIITFVRHGETDSNIGKLIHGSTCLDTPLSLAGREQARKVGIRFANDPFTAVYSSKLARARETAELIVSENKHFQGNSKSKIHVWELLRERDFGSFENKSYAEFKQAAAEAGLGGLLTWKYDPPGAETIEELRERARKIILGIFDEALLKWAPRAPSPNVLVVSHGMLLHEIFLYLAEEQACDMKGKDDAVKAKFCCNTGVTRFRVSLDADTGDTGKAYALSCVEFNNDDHLKEP